jgi:peptidylprolyl isomerase
VRNKIISVLALVAVASVVFVSCTALEGPGQLSDITVTKADPPTMKVPKGFSVATAETKIITEGKSTAATVKKGDAVWIDVMGTPGDTGTLAFNSYPQSKGVFILNVDPKVSASEAVLPPALLGELVGKHVGTRMLIALPPADGVDQWDVSKSLGFSDNTTTVFLVDVLDTFAWKYADNLPTSVPKVVLKDDGTPIAFESGSAMPKTVDSVATYVIKAGDGAAVQSGQSITADYLLGSYSTLETIQSSWSSGSAYTTKIGTGESISCWDQGLVGQKVGSTVMLVCPASTAYGTDSSSSASGDLVFIVDIKSAT